MKPWYVVIERCESDMKPWHDGDIVIGPFDTEEAAAAHGQDSLDVEDWVTSEAKSKGYTVDDVYWTQDPEIPAHGINAPVLGDSE